MRCDRNLDEMRSNFVLLTGDRRLEPRRACRAAVWLLDDDLARVVEFGAALEISREGVTFEVPRDSGLRVESLSRGREWLVLLDDPSGLEPLAHQRPALLRLERACERPDGSWRVACRFASRSVERCSKRRNSAGVPAGSDLSDVVAGDLLDELADRVARDLIATERAESWRQA